MEKKLARKDKIVMVIASRGFRDEEYFVPKEIFQKSGFQIKIASNEKGIAIGSEGGETKVDLLLEEINLNEFQAVVFSGGEGCLKSLDNERSYDLIKKAIAQDKILGAICISPVILAKAGALKGKEATVWSSPLDKIGIRTLNEFDALYQDLPVVVDEKIITASGPFVAKDFAQTIIKIINKEEI